MEPTWAAHGIPSIIFNLGLVVAGILGACFAVGIKSNRVLDSLWGYLGSTLYFLCAWALIGIGIFPETTGRPHTIVSITFFILVGLSLIVLGIAQFKSDKRNMGWLTMALFILSLLAIPLLMMEKPTGSNAIAEMIPIICISVFSIVYGIKIFRTASEEKTENERDEYFSSYFD